MAAFVLTDASITINSIDLSTKANNVTVNYEKDQVEITAFGATAHTFTGALQNITVDMELFQDLAASLTEITIFSLVGTPTTLAIKNSSAATSVTNPLYTIVGATLTSHTPVKGGVGEIAMTSLSFAGGTLTKTTA